MNDRIMYLLKYRLKEIMGFAIIVLVLVILGMCISLDKKNGFQWRPAAEVKINVQK
jgi:hypothetical protein